MPTYQSLDGVNLHYTDIGEGLPVLALAGLTRNGRDFEYVAPHLPVRIICPDYRGRGQSEWTDHETYSIEQEAQDALVLLDRLGIERAAVLGTSRGGLIAMTLAAICRDRILGVALNDIGPEIAQTGMDAIKGYLGRQPAQKTLLEAAEARAKSRHQFQGVPISRWLEEVSKHYVETEYGLMLNYDPKLRDAVLANLGPLPDLWPAFDLFEGLPLALIRGANSDLLTKVCADEMLRRRPDMIRVDVPGRGHVPFLDEPESVTALLAWLEMMQ